MIRGTTRARFRRGRMSKAVGHVGLTALRGQVGVMQTQEQNHPEEKGRGKAKNQTKTPTDADRRRAKTLKG